MSIRTDYEKIERSILSEYAAKSSESKGRRVKEEECDIRTCYQRDRDRIIHSKAFRRLKHKTQVFISPEGDHYRTRLTHTLEVAQIARTASRALRLNEDLTEAIALGHDLGHTPFGHAGENALNELHKGGFKHNLQSLRVVEYLETRSDNYPGLNLSWEVRDGIANHTTSSPEPATLEGQVVRYADRIAYINHDIDDALRGRVIGIDDLPKDCLKVLGTTSSQRIDCMVRDLIQTSMAKSEISMSDEVFEAMSALRKFMFDKVYIGSTAKAEEHKAIHIVREMYRLYQSKPELIVGDGLNHKTSSDISRMVCDYIAGMTDRYITAEYVKYFVPHAWSLHLDGGVL